MKHNIDWLAFADNLALAAQRQCDKCRAAGDEGDNNTTLVTATAGILLAELAKAVKESIRATTPGSIQEKG